jgi:hypothetical protein
VSACTPWADAIACGPCNDADFTEEELTSALAAATDVLFGLGNYKHPGACRETERPCSDYSPDPEFSWSGLMTWDRYLGFCGCARGRACGCSALSEWKPRGRPLARIVQIRHAHADNPAYPGSDVLDPAYYRIDDFTRLVRKRNPDGRNPGWPCCQPQDLDIGEPGTWQVTYDYGREPPEIGKRAVRELACQLALACRGDGDCALSPKTTQAARQGITVVLNQLSDLKSDLMGLPTVDQYVKLFNPTGRRGRLRVYSPDTRAGGRRVAT